MLPFWVPYWDQYSLFTSVWNTEKLVTFIGQTQLRWWNLLTWVVRLLSLCTPNIAPLRNSMQPYIWKEWKVLSAFKRKRAVIIWIPDVQNLNLHNFYRSLCPVFKWPVKNSKLVFMVWYLDDPQTRDLFSNHFWLPVWYLDNCLNIRPF